MGQQGLQIGPDFKDYKLGEEGLKTGAARGISNRGRDFKSREKDIKLGQKRLQIEHNILQIRAGIINRCGTILCLDPYKIT